MGLFVDVLKEGESVFKQEEALDYEFIPKALPFRENQQHALAACIKPLLQGRNGRNVFVYGAPGIGKTAATKWVLQELEQAEQAQRGTARGDKDLHAEKARCFCL